MRIRNLQAKVIIYTRILDVCFCVLGSSHKENVSWVGGGGGVGGSVEIFLHQQSVTFL